MTTLHLTALLASLATGLALPLRFEVVAGLFFAAGVVLILLNDYARRRAFLHALHRPRVLRPRATFRPLPLAFDREPPRVVVRPATLRLRAGHRLAA